MIQKVLANAQSIHLKKYYDEYRWPLFWRLDRWMQSFPVNLLTTLCILSDIGVVLTDVIANRQVNILIFKYNTALNNTTLRIKM